MMHSEDGGMLKDRLRVVLIEQARTGEPVTYRELGLTELAREICTAGISGIST